MIKRVLAIIFVAVACVVVLSPRFTLAQSDSSIACPATALPSGETMRTLQSGGMEREYLLYVPESYDSTQPASLVMSFHGYSSNPREQRVYTRWNDMADDNGFVVVYPGGTGTPLRWNAGDDFYELAEEADDVQFVSDVIDDIAAVTCIDPARVYANGMSNGGGMSNRLGCELSERIAAIGGVAGAYSSLNDGCTPTRPVPMMAFHGTADEIVPYEGLRIRRFVLPSIEDWARDWAERDGCDLTPESLPTTGDVSGVRYGNCDDDAEVILYTIAGGGHTWPGTSTLLDDRLGYTTEDINATETLWDFFAAHPMAGVDESRG